MRIWTLLAFIVLNGFFVVAAARDTRINNKMLQPPSEPANNDLEVLQTQFRKIEKNFKEFRKNIDRRISVLEKRSKRLGGFIRASVKKNEDLKNKLNRHGIDRQGSKPDTSRLASSLGPQSRTASESEPITYVVKRGGRDPIAIEKDNVKFNDNDLYKLRNKKHDIFKMSTPDNNQSQNIRKVTPNLQLMRSAILNNIAATDPEPVTTPNLKPVTNPDRQESLSLKRLSKTYTILDLFSSILTPIKNLFARFG